MTAIEQAIVEANQRYPEAELQTPQVVPPIGQWYHLDTDNPTYRGKFDLIISDVQQKNGATFPVVTLHCHKDGQNITANVAWSMFQGETPAVTINTTPNKTVKVDIAITCPTCGETRNTPSCYYCNIHEAYQQADQPLRYHPYIESKGLPVDLWESIGARCSGDMLIVPLRGTKGYQVIYGNGGKFYAVKNGMGEAHIMIGDGFDSHDIQVCEGIATGMSIHLATGKPVIVALDINGLNRTVALLRKQFPNPQTHTITILADNDVVADDSLNAGVDAAMKLAQTYDCQVVIPKNLKQSKCKVDFDDLRRIYGLDTVRKQLKKVITVSPAKPSEWAAIPNIDIVTIKSYQLEQGQYLPTNLLKPYLTNDVAEGNAPTFIFVNSPKGSGKSRGINNPAFDFAYAKDLSVGYVSPLQNLSRNIANELDIPSHLDFDDLDKLRPKPYLTFCAAGINNKFWQPDEDVIYYDILILDEIKMTLEAIVLAPMKTRLLIYDKLLKMIQNAKLVICLDADLDVETVKCLIMGYAGQVVVMDNPNQNWRGRQVVMNDDATVKAMGHHALYKNKRVLMPVASLRRAEALAQIYAKRHPDKKIWLITSKTVKDYQDFILNPNQILERDKPDLIIYTTVIGSGFSIDLEGYFDECLLFGDRHLTPDTLHQMMGRYRHWQRFNCSIPKIGHHSNKSREEHYQEIFDKADLELESLSHNKVITVDRTHPYYDLVADIKFTTSESRRYLRYNFEAKVIASGAELKQGQQANQEEQTLAKKSLRVAQVEARTKQFEKAYQLHQDNPMSEAEAKQYVESRLLRGGDDWLRFVAFDYEQFYKTSVTIEGLLEDDYGERQKQILAYERLLMSRDEVEKLSQDVIDEAITPYGLDATSVKGYLTMWDLGHNLLQALGATFDQDGLLDISSVKKITKDLLLSNPDFIQFIEDNRNQINRCHFGFTVTDNTLNDPIKFVRMVLTKLGLETYSRRSGNKRRYFICQKELSKLNEVVIQRRKNASYQPVDKKPLPDEVAHESYTEEINGVIYQFNDDGSGQIKAYLEDRPPLEPDLVASERPLAEQMAYL